MDMEKHFIGWKVAMHILGIAIHGGKSPWSGVVREGFIVLSTDTLQGRYR